MTDDLVSRLRAAFKTSRPLHGEAANEIERLRADNEMLRGLIDLPPGHHHVHVNKDGTVTAVPMRRDPIVVASLDTGEPIQLWRDATKETP